MVGLEGLEPSTNGFTCPRYFYRERTISSPSADSSNESLLGCGTLEPVIKNARY